MRTRIALMIGILIAVVTLASSVILSQQTKSYDYKDFKAVSVGWGMHLTVTQSDHYSIEVKADERDMKYLKVKKSGNKVRFEIDKLWGWRAKDDMYITITMPELRELDLSGGSEGMITMDIGQRDFEASLSGGATLDGKLQCGNVTLDLSGGAKARFSGSGKILCVDGSGGAKAQLKQFTARDVDVDLSGGARVEITMNGRLDVDASGGSKVVYYGKARRGDINLSGGSNIDGKGTEE
ncbi:MAG: head GIN domain-containing protein [bacterium]